MQRQATTAAAAVLNNRSLRRVIGAYGLFIASEYAAWICVLVWAYEQGGPRLAGAIALAQLLPAAVAAPLLAAIADSRSPVLLLVGGYLVQGTALAATAAAVALDLPGIGGVIAGVVAASLIAVRRLLVPILGGAAVLSLALAAIAFAPRRIGCRQSLRWARRLFR